MWSILVFLFLCWVALIAWAVLYMVGGAMRRHWKVVAVTIAVPVIIGAIMWAANAAHADEPRKEITVVTNPAPPPRESVEVADDYEGKGKDGGYDSHLGDAFRTRREIAAAIRAMKGKP
jgi:hypothetical protein